MKRIIAAVIFTMGFCSYGQMEHENRRHIVLPNPNLLGCKSSGCSQLWLGDPSTNNAIYPRQVIVDIFGDDPCPLGLLALYEKSVPVDDLKASIDEHYGKWAFASNVNYPVKLWRVEPERFAIQLAVTQDRTKKATREERNAYAFAQMFDQRKRSNVAEGGMGQVIYIAFTNVKCGPRGD